MGLLEKVTEELASQMVSALPQQAHARLGALLAARAARTDSDVYDQMKLANYLLYGTDEVEMTAVTTMDGTVVAAIPTEQERFPFSSGDVTVLGPQIFATTTVPAENTVINWRGENFVPQRDPVTAAVVPPDVEEDEPAPSAGLGWRGRRGDRPS
jgi:hypothetical protein